MHSLTIAAEISLRHALDHNYTIINQPAGLGIIRTSDHLSENGSQPLSTGSSGNIQSRIGAN